MAPRKTSKPTTETKKPRRGPTSTPSVLLAHRLHALLHTVRAIAHVEDELCTLLHAVEHATDVSRELLQLLARIPAHDYVVELEAIQSSLGTAKAAPENPAKPARMVKKRSHAMKKTAGAKKKRTA